MELKNCIKFTYCGLTHFIICKIDSHYEDIIKMAQTSFSIPAEYIDAIYITNGKGYIFEKHLFEYFLLLFPQPELKFFIRLDYSKIPNKQPAKTVEAIATTESRIPFGYSKLNNKRARTDEVQQSAANAQNTESMSYIASPVRRQNCFLGTIPSSRDTTESATINAEQQSSKRMRLMQNTFKPLMERKKPATTLTKRSIRI